MGSGERPIARPATFLEALEALKIAVAWEIQCQQAAARSGTEALDKIHAAACDETRLAAHKLVIAAAREGR